MRTTLSKDLNRKIGKFQSKTHSRFNSFFSNHSGILSSPDRYQKCASFNQTVSFSKFNLIKWNVKVYQPSEGEKRLKIQNDIFRNKLSSETIRPRSKAIKTEHSMVEEKNYREDYEQIKADLNSIKVEIRASQDSNYPQLLSPKIIFKEKHKSLYVHFLRKNSQCPSDQQYSQSIISQSVPLNKQARSSSIPAKKCLYMKSRIHSVNTRMEKVLTKWRPPTKSINQRYNQIWSKFKNKKNQANQSVALQKPSKLVNSSCQKKVLV